MAKRGLSLPYPPPLLVAASLSLVVGLMAVLTCMYASGLISPNEELRDARPIAPDYMHSVLISAAIALVLVAGTVVVPGCVLRAVRRNGAGHGGDCGYDSLNRGPGGLKRVYQVALRATGPALLQFAILGIGGLAISTRLKAPQEPTLSVWFEWALALAVLVNAVTVTVSLWDRAMEQFPRPMLSRRWHDIRSRARQAVVVARLVCVPTGACALAILYMGLLATPMRLSLDAGLNSLTESKWPLWVLTAEMMLVLAHLWVALPWQVHRLLNRRLNHSGPALDGSLAHYHRLLWALWRARGAYIWPTILFVALAMLLSALVTRTEHVGAATFLTLSAPVIVLGVGSQLRLRSELLGRYDEVAKAALLLEAQSLLGQLDDHAVLIGHGSLGKQVLSDLAEADQHRGRVGTVSPPRVLPVLSEAVFERLRSQSAAFRRNPSLRNVPVARRLLVVDRAPNQVFGVSKVDEELSMGFALAKVPHLIGGETMRTEWRYVAVLVLIADASWRSILERCRLHSASVVINTAADDLITQVLVTQYGEYFPPARELPRQGEGRQAANQESRKERQPVFILGHHRALERDYLLGRALHSDSTFIYPGNLAARALGRRIFAYFLRYMERSEGDEPCRILVVGREPQLYRFLEVLADLIQRWRQRNSWDSLSEVAQIAVVTDVEHWVQGPPSLGSAAARPATDDAHASGHTGLRRMTTTVYGKGVGVDCHRSLEVDVFLVRGLVFKHLDQAVAAFRPHCVALSLLDQVMEIRDTANHLLKSLERRASEAKMDLPHFAVSTPPGRAELWVHQVLEYYDSCVADSTTCSFPQGVVTVHADVRRLIKAIALGPLLEQGAPEGPSTAPMYAELNYCLRDVPGAYASILRRLCGGDEPEATDEAESRVLGEAADARREDRDQLHHAPVPSFLEVRASAAEALLEGEVELVDPGDTPLPDYEEAVRSVLVAGKKKGIDAISRLVRPLQRADELLSPPGMHDARRAKSKLVEFESDCRCPAVAHCPHTAAKRWIYTHLANLPSSTSLIGRNYIPNLSTPIKADGPDAGATSPFPMRPFAELNVLLRRESSGVLYGAISDLLLLPIDPSINLSDSRFNISYAMTEGCSNWWYAFDKIYGRTESAAAATPRSDDSPAASAIASVLIRPHTRSAEWRAYATRLAQHLNARPAGGRGAIGTSSTDSGGWRYVAIELRAHDDQMGDPIVMIVVCLEPPDCESDLEVALAATRAHRGTQYRGTLAAHLRRTIQSLCRHQIVDAAISAAGTPEGRDALRQLALANAGRISYSRIAPPSA